MALQNAFGALELDATGQAILAAITSAATTAATNAAVEAAGNYAQHQDDMFPLRTLQYSRSPADDAMFVRVNAISAGPANQVTTTNWANAAVYTGWYGTIGSPASMDPREAQKEISMQTFNDVRKQRWVIT
jgi:hypothetical protein